MKIPKNNPKFVIVNIDGMEFSYNVYPLIKVIDCDDYLELTVQTEFGKIRRSTVSKTEIIYENYEDAFKALEFRFIQHGQKITQEFNSRVEKMTEHCKKYCEKYDSGENLAAVEELIKLKKKFYTINEPVVTPWASQQVPPNISTTIPTAVDNYSENSISLENITETLTQIQGEQVNDF